MTAYWLTCCEGFRVANARGRPTVERSVFDEDPLHPVALRVRRPSGRTALIPVDAVEAMCPIERVLYVRRPPSVAGRAAAGVVAAVLAARGRVAAGRAAALAGRRSSLAPHGRRAAQLGRSAVGLGRFAARFTLLWLASLWRAGAPVAAAAARTALIAALAALAAARRRWPSTRRGLAAGGRALAIALLGTSIVAARVLRSGLRAAIAAARRLAPHGARLAGESVTLARRAIR